MKRRMSQLRRHASKRRSRHISKRRSSRSRRSSKKAQKGGNKQIRNDQDWLKFINELSRNNTRPTFYFGSVDEDKNGKKSYSLDIDLGNGTFQTLKIMKQGAHITVLN